jgi:GDPmannose 4,6-dehydratase
VRIDPRYYRPTGVNYLLGDASKAAADLVWSPNVRFHELVQIMLDADLELLGVQSPGQGLRSLPERFASWRRWESQVVSMEMG